MSPADQIAAQTAPKRADLAALHAMMLRLMPGARLWFLDGRDARGKTVSNPNIGYGERRMTLAGGKTRDFYRIGLSANTAGISVYIMGLADKQRLARAYDGRIGKATVTGYCIKFKRLSDVDAGVLEEAVRDGIGMRV